MSAPLSWQVLESLGALLQRIRIDEGYYTEAGAHVLLENASLPDDQLPALLVTGNIQTDTAEAVDADRVMRKPFTIAQIEERMARLMGAARVRQP